MKRTEVGVGVFDDNGTLGRQDLGWGSEEGYPFGREEVTESGWSRNFCVA